MGSTSGGSYVTKSVVFHTARHAHLLRFLDQSSQGVSEIIRAALELYMERQEVERRQGPVTVQEVEEACRRAIERVLKGRMVGVSGDSEVMVEISGPETETARRLQEMRDALDSWE